MYIRIFCCETVNLIVLSMWIFLTVSTISFAGGGAIFLTAFKHYHLALTGACILEVGLAYKSNAHWKHKVKCIQIENEVKTISTMRHQTIYK